jgi:predicted amidohydrolase
MKPFSIAAVQMYVDAVADNLDRMSTRLDVLMDVYPWVEMVVFSELAPFGPLTRHAQPMPGPTEDRLVTMAAKHGVWLIPGSLYQLDGSHLYNTAPVISPAGEVVARYRKMFPFEPYEEGVTKGQEFCTFEVPEIGLFAVSICYDMWFPETTRTLACLGAEVLIHPSLTPTIDRDVELAIGRATAAQNQMFVFDVNGVGAGGNGQTQIIGPAGEVLHLAGRAEETIPIEIDLDRVRRSREVGLRSLGQPLKSFRDRAVSFDVYQQDKEHSFLATLGPLAKPKRRSLAGLTDFESEETTE